MAEFELEFQFRGRRFRQAAQGLQQLAARNGGIDIDKIGGPAISRAMREFLTEMAKAMAVQHGSPWPGGTSPAGTTPGSLSRRTGQLIASIQSSIRVTGDLSTEIEGRIGGSSIAAVHERGAVIRPRRAQFLTVPLPAALNPDGTPKKPSARDWEKTFVIESKKGNLLIVQRDGHNLIPLYVLKKEVRIPPRLGLGQLLQVSAPFFAERAANAMLRELQRAIAT